MQFISKSEVGEITLTHILKTAGVKELKFLVSPYLGSKIKQFKVHKNLNGLSQRLWLSWDRMMQHLDQKNKFFWVFGKVYSNHETRIHVLF